MLGWVSWQNVEPGRGAFAWQSGGANDLDNVANAGRAYGLKVLVRVQSPPAWATVDGSGRLARVDPDEVRRSMEALARRGAGRVAAYQVFNEPNLAYEWGEDVDAARRRGTPGCSGPPTGASRPATRRPSWSAPGWPTAPRRRA